ncbi:MAG: type VI immunity family protein [bacterium]
MIDYKKFEVYKKKVLIVSLVADIVLYIDEPFTEIQQPILDLYNRFFTLCPKEDLNWYLTNTMTSHKPTSKRTFTMLNTWLQEGARKRDTISIELKSSKDYNGNPSYLMDIFGNERTSRYYNDRANFIRHLIPTQHLEKDPNDFLALVINFCNQVPFVSGHAGFAFERSPYWESASYQAVFPLAIRYQGVDVADTFNASRCADRENIKGVNWLTMLSHKFLEQLGGLEAIKAKIKKIKDVEIIEVTHGAILKAGKQPGIGDITKKEMLPAYRAVFQIVKDLIVKKYTPFDIDERATRKVYREKEDNGQKLLIVATDEREQTMKWIRRFEDDYSTWPKEYKSRLNNPEQEEKKISPVEVKLELLDYGVFIKTEGGEEVTTSNIIKAQMGLRFGLKYKLENKNCIGLTAEVENLEQTSSWPINSYYGTAIWIFEDEKEFVPGKWKFRIKYDDHLLLEHKFEIMVSEKEE